MSKSTEPGDGFDIVDVAAGLVYVAALPLLPLYNAVAFAFYASIFCIVAFFLSLFIESPFSLILALVPLSILMGSQCYNHIEKWISKNNIPRILMLIAHTCAGVACGRVIGFYLHENYATITPLFTFQLIGALFVAWINTSQYLRRGSMSLKQCLSFSHVVK